MRSAGWAWSGAQIDRSALMRSPGSRGCPPPGGAVVQGTGPVLLSAAAVHEVRKDDPVSSRVLRLARTAGHPSEMAGKTALPGAKPSWVTVSLTAPWPTPAPVPRMARTASCPVFSAFERAPTARRGPPERVLDPGQSRDEGRQPQRGGAASLTLSTPGMAPSWWSPVLTTIGSWSRRWSARGPRGWSAAGPASSS